MDSVVKFNDCQSKWTNYELGVYFGIAEYILTYMKTIKRFREFTTAYGFFKSRQHCTQHKLYC